MRGSCLRPRKPCLAVQQISLSPMRVPVRCSGTTQPIYSQPMSHHSTASGAVRPAPSGGARLVTADGRALPLEWVDLESEAGGGVARSTLESGEKGATALAYCQSVTRAWRLPARPIPWTTAPLPSPGTGSDRWRWPLARVFCRRAWLRQLQRAPKRSAQIGDTSYRAERESHRPRSTAARDTEVQAAPTRHPLTAKGSTGRRSASRQAMRSSPRCQRWSRAGGRATRRLQR